MSIGSAMIQANAIPKKVKKLKIKERIKITIFYLIRSFSFCLGLIILKEFLLIAISAIKGLIL